MRLVALFCLIMFLGLSAVASARDLTGIYVKVYSTQVEYFNLTEQHSTLTGYYQIVRADSNASDGLDRVQYGVSGSVEGGRAILNVSSMSDGSYQWTADVTWSGFVLSVPQTSGQIKQVTFTASTVSEVNAKVAQLTQTSTTAKSLLNVEQDLISSSGRVSQLANYRPQLVDQLHKAQASIRAAVAKKQQLEQRVADLEAIAAEKHKEADAAKAAATTSDEQYAAGSLGYDAGSADYDVTSAGYDVKSAQYTIDSATDDMKRLQAKITGSDDEVAALKLRISQDRYYLAHVH